MDTLVQYDSDTVITGSSDGIIRLINILPNKMIGVLGEHEDYPVERLALSEDRKLLVSASHDSTLKLWDLQKLLDDSNEDEVGLCAC